jgi:hypothetical protein
MASRGFRLQEGEEEGVGAWEEMYVVPPCVELMAYHGVAWATCGSDGAHHGALHVSACPVQCSAHY